jgi:hypothetical protein
MDRFLLSLLLVSVAGCVKSDDDSSSKSLCDDVSAKIYGGESCRQDARSAVVLVIPVGNNGTKWTVKGCRIPRGRVS